MSVEGFEGESGEASCRHDLLTASTVASPPAAAGAGLPALEAVLAVHGTVAPGLEWNRGLLSAP